MASFVPFVLLLKLEQELKVQFPPPPFFFPPLLFSLLLMLFVDVLITVRNYKGDGVVRPFVCIHARIEGDWNIGIGLLYSYQNFAIYKLN